MSIIKFLKKSHKWIATLIGIQLILWISSGIVFSFIDHRNVSGEFIYKKQQQAKITRAVDFYHLIKRYPNATKITQLDLIGITFIKVELQDESILLEAISGFPIVVDEGLIDIIAEQYYRGGGKIKSINYIDQLSDENRGFDLPSWQVVFDDEYQSHLYFSADSAEYQGVRTDSWRTQDFFMMLHFMDYGQRGNFNHALIIFAALVMLFFTLSGILLLYSGFSKKDFISIINRFYQHKYFIVSFTNNDGHLEKIKANKDDRLLDVLATKNIELESICGGGGICGGCRIKIIDSDNKVTQEIAEMHDILSDDELASGYRLACQLSIESDIKIDISLNN